MSSEWQYHANYMRKFKDVYQDGKMSLLFAFANYRLNNAVGRRWRIWDHESGPRSLLPIEQLYETTPSWHRLATK